MFDLSFLIFLNAVFLALIGLLAQQDDKHATRARIWRYLAFFFVGISLLLGQEVKEREQSKQEEQGEADFRRWIAQLKETGERLRYERELRIKADEIADLNRTIAGSVTGGDSFIYLAFTPEPNSNNAMLSLLHRGKFPVFDVSIELSDADEVDDRLRALGLKDKSGSLTLDQMLELIKTKATFNYPTVRPNLALRVRDKWQLPADKDLVRYRFAIYTRNGTLSQNLILQRVNGSWAQASQIFRNSNSKKRPALLYEWADPRFPRNKQGKVDW
jgi:hypothetical protein